MHDKIDLEKYKLLMDTGFEATNPNTMGSQLIDLLVTLMEVKGGSIFIVNPEAEELEILATEGLSIKYVNKGPILVDKSIKLAPNRVPVIIKETRGSDQLQYPEKAAAEGIRSIVSLPVTLNTTIIGALRLYHSQPWDVTERELIYLGLLTRHLALALKYFRLSSVVVCTKELLNEIHPIWL